VSKNDIAVIILAAGKGTRMNSDLPKILHTVCGKAMIEHVINTAQNLNPNKIITVVNNDVLEQVMHLNQLSEFVVQEQQLGTADAVKPALEKLKDFKGSVVIVYADTPLITSDTLSEMLGRLVESDVVVLGFEAENPGEYGRLIIDEEGCLKEIVEYKDADLMQKQINLCNSGVIAAKSGVLSEAVFKIDNNNKKAEYYLTDIIKIANKAKQKCSFILCKEEEVLGVNNRVQLSDVEYILQQKLRYRAMTDGVTLIDPKTVYFSFDTVLGKDVVIHPNVVFGSKVRIEDNVEIKSFSHIEGAIIASECIVGPFARIRPGTKLERGARVGNFVEIKKAKIGKGSKIGHLSYIGDATLGDKVNIGAGTVTCNYDGKNKHKTNIESGAFIGSNTSIVAPVNIGTGAVVAAGSTITKNVDSNSLAIARSHQIIKKKKK
jgi:bifunctional UDP-N-acetylglucosamine pyrophosphorylase/glucosamine-1-phosphate N-acetyltransferase